MIIRPIELGVVGAVTLSPFRGLGGGSSPASLLPLNTPLFADGDSMTDVGGDKCDSWTWHLQRLTSGRMNYRGEYGTGGHTSTQMLAGMAEYSGSLSGAILILWGIENDIGGTPVVDAATTEANYNAMIVDATMQGVAAIVILPAAPTNNILFNGLGARKTAFDAFIAAHSNPLVTFVPNAWDGIELAASSGVPGADSDDGTHPNIVGNRKLAANIAPTISALLETGDALDAMAAITGAARGLGTKAAFTGAGAGVLATGWALTNAHDATIAYSAGTLNGLSSQIVTLSGSNTLSGESKIKASGSVSYTTGQPLIAIGQARFSNAAQDGPPVGLQTFGFEGAGRGALFMTRSATAATGNWGDGLTGPTTMMMRSKPKFPTAPNTFVDLEIGWRLATGTIDIRMEFADCDVWRAAAAA